MPTPITLRQFEYFLALAETGQVSKAALRCNVSQSTMTIALRNLEDSLNVPLFVRHAKGLRLTDEGERFVRHAQNVTGAFDRALDDMRAAPDEVSGSLRLGVTETISAYLMPAVIAAVAQRFPNLSLQVMELERHDVEQRLLRGQLDLGLVIVSNLTRFDKLQYDTMLRSPRRLWTHPDHPLQQAGKVTLRDVSEADYIMLDMDEHIETVGKYWGRYSLAPRVRYQSRSPEAVRSLVALQQGVTILSDLVYRPWSLEGRRILRRDISDEVPTMDIGGVWPKRSGLGRSGELLMNFLRTSIKALANA
ncbi:MULTISPECIES: LysR family transcriptional regulator [unclassified Achromobacter]|uniref:LysR family transcriptional regulator n=1 Tax=unclassified Achromobacter TaxID=2626865 RepID=UPI000B514D1F|nr:MULTISPECIES: LysR family transcriptional regulator [unclassified Achromobacter]OWT67360.1 LysR family transcriptional regulator [Achromobacter sp. HZ34]OWT67391.1 LysR family transcriptional regulator [Achromobacter sp. HZ28]